MEMGNKHNWENDCGNWKMCVCDRNGMHESTLRGEYNKIISELNTTDRKLAKEEN